ncbi:MAG TPA: response regulator [Gaiellaceae bacterium]|nr:response regulator [Gaiellaceae bacterium]
MEAAVALASSAADVRQSPLIVIADDDPDIRLLVGTRLRRFGYDVISASTGDEALAAIYTHRPDIAVLDVRMPGLTGIEITHRLRHDPELKDLPIILLTASVSGADVAAGYDAGATDYIPKPFSPQDLRARVELLLAGA